MSQKIHIGPQPVIPPDELRQYTAPGLTPRPPVTTLKVFHRNLVLCVTRKCYDRFEEVIRVCLHFKGIYFLAEQTYLGT